MHIRALKIITLYHEKALHGIRKDSDHKLMDYIQWFYLHNRQIYRKGLE